MEHCLKLDPDQSGARTELAQIHLDNEDLDAAQPAANPKDGAAHYKLSQVLLRKHEIKQANKERALGLSLNAEAKRASKTQLVLAMPGNDSQSQETHETK